MNSEFLVHFKLPLKVLEPLGLWQTKEKSKKYRVWGFISQFIFLELYFILPIVYLLKVKQFELEVMNFAFLLIGPIFKVLNLLSQMELVEDLLSELTDLINFTKFDLNSARNELKNQMKFIIRLFIFTFGLMILSVAMDSSVPFFGNGLPYKMWTPYSYDNVIVFWITSVLQITIAIVGSAITVSLEFIPVNFMGMAAILLTELSERMKLIAEGGKTDDEMYQELVKCIEIHLRIKSFVKKIENCFSITFFAQGFLSATFFCVTGFVLSTVCAVNLNQLFLTQLMINCIRRYRHSINCHFLRTVSSFYCRYCCRYFYHRIMEIKSHWLREI
jgi:7tm Odorant receptor